MLKIRPKKHLGQHFLTDHNIAEKIFKSLSFRNYSFVVEVGPGTGVLTRYLLKNTSNFFLVELDRESVNYLREEFPSLKEYIVQADFLKWEPLFSSFALIGNFPYNISSQILFRVLEYRNSIPECVGMFQKEVAERIAAKCGNKIYGILSVLVQTFYEVDYLFTVNEQVFSPPPKVKSAVIRLRRKSHMPKLEEGFFFKLVKSAFNQRRKTLRNALKPLKLSDSFYKIPVLDQRAEQLSVGEFIELSQKI
ncbi:16S rRNA (adenine(1518)-N(6)/adenine(1519)-N(6))-dimethyltransferase RsmA [Bacteroidetes bacterium endosymbiont of Geopemphigus sp.]|uniref:16S rRNA (adenine(1518)-N(6)/adenine(1519)-N(6))- dimethyltransferase RsmA n=1 Tax=Bacteroidetes bacterium endosymbiont of Geopemphigus sp. TaxID=2047937 RepID=UPI000CD150D2|nr:16S rRNA (adenine(1518)-N(6)/adenine(1519)-N(6))-dimethyltransferase RsmA [Bacteroidetes bacterium endosymbiont of Geopemphigus sp.]